MSQQEHKTLPTQYAITASVVYKTTFGEVTSQLPTFLLDRGTHGIRHKEHAEAIALRIIKRDERAGFRYIIHVEEV